MGRKATPVVVRSPAEAPLSVIQEAIRRKGEPVTRVPLREYVQSAWPIVEPYPFLPNWHIDAVCQHLEAVSDGQIARLIINEPPGFAKALDIETPILTTWGWTPHGALRPGDFVFGPDGEPKRVEAITDPRVEPTYALRFDDGAEVVAGDGHLWDVERDLSETPRRRRHLIVTTPELFAGARPDAIRVTQPVRLAPKRLLIDPYLLGAWLGDGASGQGCLYAGEQDAGHFLSFGVIGNIMPAGGTRTQAFYRILVPELQTKLRVLGVLGNKHIPDEYLEASIDQRIALLQGLMDTDGSCYKNGTCAFGATRSLLATGVRRLVTSLGMKAHSDQRYSTLNGQRYGPHYRVMFRPNATTPPIFRLTRKQARVQPIMNERYVKRYLKTLEPAGERTVNCIQVEGSRYLAGYDLVPTHNSIVTSLMWQTWEWGPANHPKSRWLVVSYGGDDQAPAVQFAERARGLMQSAWYQQQWASVFQLSDTQNAKGFYRNNRHGYRVSLGLDGTISGQRADRILIDDPSKAEAIFSPDELKRPIRSWEQTLRTRSVDKGSAVVLVMHRLHEEDLTGYFLKQDGWTHLRLPAQFEAAHRCRVFLDGSSAYTQRLFWEDPRTTDGEPLHPLLTKAIADAQQQQVLDPWTFAAQQQQTPSPREGSIVKRIERWTTLPDSLDEVIVTVDCAFKAEKHNSFVVFQKWARRHATVYLLDQVRAHMELPATIAALEEFCRRVPLAGAKYVEAKANGIGVVQMLRNQVPGLMTTDDDAVLKAFCAGSKEAKLQAVAPFFAAGNVAIPGEHVRWTAEYVHELEGFPRGTTHDDQVDATSMAVWRLLYTRQAFVNVAATVADTGRSTFAGVFETAFGEEAGIGSAYGRGGAGHLRDAYGR